MSPLRASDLSPAMAKQLGVKVTRPNKYRAKRITVDGIAFDSQREAAVIGRLLLQQKAGVIRDLEIHPSYEIRVNGTFIGVYEADARYFDVLAGKIIIIDVKSKPTRTPLYRLKRKLVEAIHQVQIQEVK